MKASETVLPDTIKRGKAVEVLANLCKIDLEDTQWMEEPYYTVAPWHTKTERVFAYLSNYEWRLWKGTIVFVAFIL